MSLYIMNRIGTEVLAASQSTPFYQSFPFMIVLTIVLVVVAVVVTAVVVKKGAKSAPVSSAPVTVKPQKAQKEPEFMAQQKQNKIQMLANISAGIKEPLYNMMDANDRILGLDISDETRTLAKSINQNGEQLVTLLNNLKDLADLDAGKLLITEKEYDTQEFVLDLCNDLMSRAKQKGLEVELDISRQIPSKMSGDIKRLGQIIHSLLDNAIDHTTQGTITLSVLSVRTSEHEIMLTVKVQDTGCGIRTEDHEKIFEDFQTDSSSGGMGLGLSISRKLLRLMNSDLLLESEVGQGAKFIFEVKQSVIDERPIGDITILPDEDDVEDDAQEKERLEKEKQEKEKLEKERLEKERLEKERLEKERLEKERLEKERLEKERLEKERLEKERLDKERLEKERLEKERLEKERLEQERLEKERLEKERLEKERLEKERLEKERLEKERLEQERLEKERLEKERLEKERLEQERLEKERLEKERLEKERLEKERLEKERLEQERLEKERLEKERLEKERLEKERLEKERLEKERLEKERLEKERLEKERLEKERLEKERLEKERLEKERLEKERLEKERLEKERLEKERLEKERLEKERLEKERLEQERLEKERLEKERLEKERLEKERLEKERLEKERLEQERLEKERLEKERLEKERLEKERLEKERLEKERLEQERLEKERLEKERLEKERLEQERLEKERLEKERLEQERLEKERLEKERQAEENEQSEEPEMVKKIHKKILLDEDFGLLQCSGQQDLYELMIQMYLDESKSKMKKIGAALEKKDYQACTAVFNTLKSTSKTIGAVEVSDIAEELENLTNVERVRNEEPILKLKKKLDEAYDKAILAIHIFLDDAKETDTVQKSEQEIVELVETYEPVEKKKPAPKAEKKPEEQAAAKNETAAATAQAAKTDAKPENKAAASADDKQVKQSKSAQPAAKAEEAAKSKPEEKQEPEPVVTREEPLVILDQKAGLDNSSGAQDMYELMLQMYLDESPAKLKKLQKAFEEQDWQTYGVNAANMKSTSTAIGAMAVGKTAAKLEAAAKVERRHDVAFIEAQHAMMLDYYEQTIKEIKTALGI